MTARTGLDLSPGPGGAAESRPAGWGVVGGGILGMTLAWRLARAGHAVQLFEASPDLGGLTSAWRLGDVVWDRFYHVTLASDTALRRLLGELDLGRDLRFTRTRTGFFAGGRLHSVSNTLEFLRFPPLDFVSRLRLALTLLYASLLRDGRRLERVPVVEWLERWSGRRAVETVWLPLLRAKLGDAYRDTSAAFIWATARRLYGARGGGAAKREVFGYLPGGYARILARFADALAGAGVRVNTGCAVREVVAGPGGGVRVRLADGREGAFGRVVVTAAAPLAARLCPDLAAEERARLTGVRYLGVVCPSVLLKRPLGGFYVTNIADAGIPFTAVVEMTALVDPAQFGGRTLVYLPRYLPSDDPALDRPDEAIAEEFLAGLRRIHPGLDSDDVVACRVARARQVCAVPTLGYSERLPPTITSVPGLILANSAHIVDGTLNVNGTVQLAERIATGLLTGCAPLSRAGAPQRRDSPPARRARQPRA